MRISVDPDRCKGHTMCNMVAPHLFSIDPDEGYASVDNPDVPAGDEQIAQDAANSCPEKAVLVED